MLLYAHTHNRAFFPTNIYFGRIFFFRSSVYLFSFFSHVQTHVRSFIVCFGATTATLSTLVYHMVTDRRTSIPISFSFSNTNHRFVTRLTFRLKKKLQYFKDRLSFLKQIMCLITEVKLMKPFYKILIIRTHH